ncbi:MAG: hypothetical protein QW756_02415 [Nitrososphaerota archaeon]
MGRRRRPGFAVLGVVTRAGKGKVLLNAARIPHLSTKVYDQRGAGVGYVSNVLGPESSPHIVVKLTSKTIPKIGEKLYLEDGG